MVDSARLGAVVDECTAGASELVVEGDRCGEAAEPGENAFSEAGEGAGAVPFEREDVFAGPEDRFDSLSEGCQVRAPAGLVFAMRADDGGAQLLDLGAELSAGVNLVAQQGLAALALAAFQQQDGDVTLVDLRRSELNRSGRPVGGEDRV